MTSVDIRLLRRDRQSERRWVTFKDVQLPDQIMKGGTREEVKSIRMKGKKVRESWGEG
jgi:hypothetical protein